MAQSSQKNAMTFHIFRGDELVRTQTISKEVVRIGQLASSDLQISDDDTVGKFHAVIETSGPNDIFIIDVGSAASGTFVNGQKVTKDRLQSGDEIRVGNTRIKFELAEGASSGLAAPEPTRVSEPARVSLSGAAPVAAAAGGFGRPSAPPEGRVQYGIVASGPPVRPEDVETAAPAVEVVIMWGDSSVLHVAHLSPPREFVVGEGTPKEGVDFLMSPDALGAARMPLVVQHGDGAAVVIPQGATGEVLAGNQRLSIADLVASGRTSPSSALPGAQIYPVPAGATARVYYRGFSWIVRSVNQGRRIGFASSFGERVALGVASMGALLAYFFMVAGLATAFLIAIQFIPRGGDALSLDLFDTNSRLVKMMMDAQEMKEEETPEWLQNTDKPDDEGGKGKRHKDEEGAMGKNDAKKTNNKYAIEGPKDNEDQHMAREAAKEQARNAGILGVLRANTGAWNSPTSPYGRDTALGADPTSALGALMGDQIGENFGFGGLGLRGTGRGGGGTGEGTIGLGNLGTIGHGGGGGDGSGYGRGAGGFSGRTSKVPKIKQGTADVRGGLSKEVIRRVVQRHINEVRFCYEQQLASRPDLEGRVTMAFVISATGAVQSASVASSTMGNSAVEGCISQAVRRWVFPQPEGGGVVIVSSYPFMLNAAGGGE